MNTATIRGIIIPADWNHEGDVVRLAIVTYDEDYFLVAQTALGKALGGLLREKVIVEGTIKERNALKTIYIQKYEVDRSIFSDNDGMG